LPPTFPFCVCGKRTKTEAGEGKGSASWRIGKTRCTLSSQGELLRVKCGYRAVAREAQTGHRAPDITPPQRAHALTGACTADACAYPPGAAREAPSQRPRQLVRTNERTGANVTSPRLRRRQALLPESHRLAARLQRQRGGSTSTSSTCATWSSVSSRSMPCARSRRMGAHSHPETRSLLWSSFAVSGLWFRVTEPKP